MATGQLKSTSDLLDELRIDEGEDIKKNFIYKIVEKDFSEGKFKEIITRFPPEPNGYLHIGHAKSICLNFDIARRFGGRTNVRFDDTNPKTEKVEYINAIMEDVKWIGYDWGVHLYFASDYFQQLYDWAIILIKKGLAYVDDQTAEEIKNTRGTLTEPGIDSPFRDRTVEENLRLFEKMKNGDFEDGHCVLRAKIDMKSGNINMRDPIMYRIVRCEHPNTKDEWIIYPTYDYAHGQCDSIEKITHSICTTEFEVHRPLYDWFQDNIGILKTRQIEFARLNLSYCVMNKRLLVRLIEEKLVSGWDDPRMPTISGLRRRGCPARAVRRFCRKIGVAKRENLIQIELLEDCIRKCMIESSPKFFLVIDPILVEIEGVPEDFEESLEIPNPPDETPRRLKFAKWIYIDKKDFMETPSEDFIRLSPGEEVRLRYSHWIKCKEVIKKGDEIEKLICEYGSSTKDGSLTATAKKKRATIHWIHPDDAEKVEIRWYSRLFTKPDPKEELEGGKCDWIKNFNRDSLKVYRGFCEMAATKKSVGDPIHFERHGYFTKDPDSTDEKFVFNLTVGMSDSFEKHEFTESHKEMESRRREAAVEARKLKKQSKRT